MKRIAILFVAAFLILAWFTYDQFAPPFKRGDQAPYFMLSDINGETVRLSDFLGKPVLVHFWATWCSQCAAEMPYLIDFQRTNPDIKVLAISEDEGVVETVRSFFGRSEIGLTVLLDTDGEVANFYKSYKVPESFLLDKEGKILHRFIGLVEWNKPKNANFIKELLKH